MNSTRVYKLIDQLIKKEFSHINDLNKFPTIKEKFMKWDNGNLKGSYFINALTKEIDKKESMHE